MKIKAYSIIGIIQIVSAAVILGNNGQHWYGELWQAGFFLVIPFLFSYNGKKESILTTIKVRMLSYLFF